LFRLPGCVDPAITPQVVYDWPTKQVYALGAQAGSPEFKCPAPARATGAPATYFEIGPQLPLDDFMAVRTIIE
jgi:hypothetical protein